MSKDTVEIELDRKFYESVQKVMEENPWMGYESVDDFVVDAIWRRLEALYSIEADIQRLKREAAKK